MNGELVQQGATLMLVGMGTVFVFLTALVLGMLLLGAVASRFKETPATPAGVTDEEVAAITAAVTTHRRQ